MTAAAVLNVHHIELDFSLKIDTHKKYAFNWISQRALNNCNHGLVRNGLNRISSLALLTHLVIFISETKPFISVVQLL